MRKSLRIMTALIIANLAISTANAVDVYPVFTNVGDMGVAFQDVVVFADAPGFGVDTTATDGTNDIIVYSQLDTPDADGYGFTISASNGENGIDDSEAGANTDVPSPHALNPAIAAVNGGGKIQNGNAFRLSVWMRQDPNDPVTAAPQIEPVLKFEIWKEADSGNADFAAADYPGFGDRIWDTDQNGGSAVHVGNGQSQASWVDVNNSGTTSFGKPVHESLVTTDWRLIETTLVIDDDPEDLGAGLGWEIGADPFTVADIEEIRGVIYSGDFASTNFAGGAGSIWADNILLEVFADEATMNATPNANPMPGSGPSLLCDLDADGDCDSDDIDMLYAGSPSATDIGTWLTQASDPANPYKLASGGTAADVYVLGDVNLNGDVDSDDLGLLLNNFGSSAGPGWGGGDLNANMVVDSDDLGLLLNNFGNTTASAAAAAAVPEPSSVALILVALCGAIASRRRR